MAIPEGYTPLGKIGLNYKGEYVSGTTYSRLDAVYYLGSTYVALIDSPAGAPNNDGVNWRYLAQGAGDDISDSAITFTEAGTRENITSGESAKTLMGKIKKWFSDLAAAAFAQMLSSYSDLMANTVTGYLVDALAVKEGFKTVNSNLANTSEIIGYGTTNQMVEISVSNIDKYKQICVVPKFTNAYMACYTYPVEIMKTHNTFYFGLDNDTNRGNIELRTNNASLVVWCNGGVESCTIYGVR